jgi:tellurite resistance protein
MSNRHTRNSVGVSKAEIMAVWQERRDGELLDAVVSAAALVARADGKADAVERAQTAYFLARNERLATVTPTDILDAFDHRLRHLQERSGIETAVDGLRRIAGHAPVRLIIDAAEHIAAADGHLHPGEMHALRSIRKALRAPSRPQIA